jgi:hypothetical protein
LLLQAALMQKWWVPCSATAGASLLAGSVLVNQSINVTPVAMRLKKLMPAIH